MSRHKKDKEQALIRWRRKQVAEYWFEGLDVKTIAAKLKVSPSLIYEDQEYIENHADDLMKNYLVKTVPHLINKSLYQIDLANKEAIKILKDQSTTKKEKISADLAVSKTARDVVEIIAGNKGIVDKALELDLSLRRGEEEEEIAEEDEGVQGDEDLGTYEEEEVIEKENELLSGNSIREEESTADPQAKF